MGGASRHRPVLVAAPAWAAVARDPGVA